MVRCAAATALALPQFGLSTVFLIAFVSATLLPLGSEPAVFGLVKLNPELFWPAVVVATAGNTLGGVVTYWMGYGAERAYEHVTHKHRDVPRAAPGCERTARRPACCRGCRSSATRCARWPAGCKLPFWPCVVYMAIGKFVRYFVMTAALLWVFPGAVHALTIRMRPCTRPTTS